MRSFLEIEKARYMHFKQETPYFSALARVTDGDYKKLPRPFCLPVELAYENLYPPIQKDAKAFFAKHTIKWHDGKAGNPSNHLCDSQVCCVNFLFPFGDQPEALATLLHPLFPDLEAMEMIEGGRYVSFEWIGAENYLGEIISRNGKRTRGANYTSADAAVMFRRKDGKRQIVLIEWKYTESYSSTPYHIAKSGRSRVAIYQHLYDAADCPLDKQKLSDFGALFYEPFYQLMRQQFLAARMEAAHELDAEIVSLLHIAPAQNQRFRRITSPTLYDPYDPQRSATGLWQALVGAPDRFQSVSTEALFGALTTEKMPVPMHDWLAYIGARYAWVREARL